LSSGYSSDAAGRRVGEQQRVETHGRDSCWTEGAPVSRDEGRAWRAIGDHIIGLWNARAGGGRGAIRSATWLDGRRASNAATFAPLY
jgi:hypothetical protein